MVKLGWLAGTTPVVKLEGSVPLAITGVGSKSDEFPSS